MQRKKPSIARRLVSGVLALGLLASPMTAWATEYPPSEVLDMTSFVEQLPSESQVAFVEEQQEQIPEVAQVASEPTQQESVEQDAQQEENSSVDSEAQQLVTPSADYEAEQPVVQSESEQPQDVSVEESQPVEAAAPQQELTLDKDQLKALLEETLWMGDKDEAQIQQLAQKLEQLAQMPLTQDQTQDAELQELLSQLANAQVAVEDMRLAWQAQREGWLDELPQTGKENSWRYQNGERTTLDLGLDLPEGVSTFSVGGKWGIDVSHHQGTIDWQAVKNAGIDFAIVRLGYGDDLTNQDDRQWHANVAACERLGIPYGVYLYSYAVTSEMAASEAAHALRLLQGHRPQLPVYYDLEENRQLVVGNSGLAELARIFCTTMEAAGYKAGVYASLNWWQYYLTDPIFENWSRWVAEWRSSCSYTGRYEMWQYTDNGRIAGISGAVDMNYWYGNDWQIAVPQPTGLAAWGTTQGNEIQWNAVAGASHYRVYRKEAGGSWRMLADVTSTGYLDTKAVSGTQYYYSVAAAKRENGANRWSVYDTIGAAAMYVARPTGLRASQSGAKIDVSWNAVAGASHYRVYRKEAGGNWRMLADVTSTSYADTNVKSGVQYQYSVAAAKKTSTGNVWSGYDTTGVSAVYVAMPTDIKVSQDNNRVTVNWSKVAGATHYRVYRKEANGNWRMLGDVTSNSYTDASVKSGVQYSYTVSAAKKIGGVNYWSGYNTTGVSLLHIAVPAQVKVSQDNNRVTVSWNAVAGATHYRVYRKEAGGNWRMLGDVTSLRYVDTDVKSGVEYAYSVAAAKKTNTGNTWSGYDATGASLVHMAMPTQITMERGEQTVTIRWSAVSGATHYRVYRKEAGGNWRMLGDVVSTGYIDSTAKPGVQYSYSVAAAKRTNTGNHWSGYDAAGVGLPQPSGLKVSKETEGVSLNWNAVEGATHYRIYRKEAGGNWRMLEDVTSTSYLDTTAKAGVAYSYTISAANKTSQGNYWSGYDSVGVPVA